MNRASKVAARHRPLHAVEVRLENLQQFFNSMDPSPFYDRDLDPDAEQFIVSWVQEFPVRDPVRLVLHLGTTAPERRTVEVEEAVHNHFRNQARLAQLEFRHLMRMGSRSLIIGLTVLTACIIAGEVLTNYPGNFSEVLRQSLVIGGWVAMWQPIQLYLYGWWPLLRRRQVFEKLGRIPVEIRMDGHRPETHHASRP